MAHGFGRSSVLVRGEIVEDDDCSRRELRYQHLGAVLERLRQVQRRARGSQVRSWREPTSSLDGVTYAITRPQPMQARSCHRAGDVYYWPPGHTVWVDEDYEAIEFSPSGQMGELMNHLEAKLTG